MTTLRGEVDLPVVVVVETMIVVADRHRVQVDEARLIDTAITIVDVVAAAAVAAVVVRDRVINLAIDLEIVHVLEIVLEIDPDLDLETISIGEGN